VEQSGAGRHASARQLFARAVDASPRLAAPLMQELRRAGIPFFVSPYEADAQLGWLSRLGLVDAVLSEDSDCLPYRCRRVLLKLDRDGWVVEMTRMELFRFWGKGKLPLHSGALHGGAGKGASREARNGIASVAPVLPRGVTSAGSASSSGLEGDKIDLTGFTDGMFLDMCLLCGCDYVDSPKGVGASAACKWVRRFRGATQRMLTRMRFDGLLPSSGKQSGGAAHYEEQFRRARMTFLHQTVVDPRSGACCRCQDLPASAEEAADRSIRQASSALHGGGASKSPGSPSSRGKEGTQSGTITTRDATIMSLPHGYTEDAEGG